MAAKTVSLYKQGLLVMAGIEHASNAGDRAREVVDTAVGAMHDVRTATKATTVVGNALYTLWTPGDVLTYMQRIDARVSSLNADILRSVADPARVTPELGTFSLAWDAYRNGWRQYFDGHQSWISRLNAGTVADELERYEAELNDWATRAGAQHVAVSAPMSRPRTGGSIGGPNLSKVLTVGGIVLGIGATAWLLHEWKK